MWTYLLLRDLSRWNLLCFTVHTQASKTCQVEIFQKENLIVHQRWSVAPSVLDSTIRVLLRILKNFVHVAGHTSLFFSQTKIGSYMRITRLSRATLHFKIHRGHVPFFFSSNTSMKYRSYQTCSAKWQAIKNFWQILSSYIANSYRYWQCFSINQLVSLLVHRYHWDEY